MTTREFSPLRLDVAAFIQARAEADGTWPLGELPRLAGGTVCGAAIEAFVIAWRVRGEVREPDGPAPQFWLLVEAQAQLPFACQRCLQPVTQDLQVRRWIRFVEDEGEAAELDAQSEEDFLALTSSLDLRWLIEDELILESPLVPRHADCSPPGKAPDASINEAPMRENPFKMLSQLKRVGGGDPDKN